MMKRMYQTRVPLLGNDLVIFSIPKLDLDEQLDPRVFLEKIGGSPIHQIDPGHTQLAVLAFLHHRGDPSDHPPRAIETGALDLLVEPRLIPVRHNPLHLGSLGAIAATATAGYLAGPLLAFVTAGATIFMVFATSAAKEVGKRAGEELGAELARWLRDTFEHRRIDA